MFFLMHDIPVKYRRFLILTCIGIFMYLCFTGIVQRPQPSQQLSAITLTPRAEPYFLGNDLLGQYPGAFSADKSHIELRYDAHAQTWRMRNISPNGKKLLFITPEGKEFIAKQWLLQDKDKIIIDDTALTVHINGDGNLLIMDPVSGNQYRWDGYALHSDQVGNYIHCPQTGMISKLHRFIRQKSHKLIHKTGNSFSLGGQVQCHNRLALKNIDLHSAKIFNDEKGDYYLRPAAGKNISLIRDNAVLLLPAINVNNHIFIAGRTYYKADVIDQHKLKIYPIKNIHLFPQFTQGEDQEQQFIPYHSDDNDIALSWENRQQQNLFKAIADIKLKGINFYIIILSVLAVLIYNLWLLRVCFAHGINIAHFPVISVCAVLCWSVGYFALPAGQLLVKVHLYILLWILVCILIIKADKESRLFLFWVLLSILSIAGIAMQLQLAMGSLNEKWYKFPSNHLNFYLTLLMVVVLLMPFPRVEIYRISEFFQKDRMAEGFGAQIGYGIAIVSLTTLLLFVLYYAYSLDNKILFIIVASLFMIFIYFLYKLRGQSGSILKTFFFSFFILLIIAQGVFGNEEGLAGVQPVELAKIIVIVIISLSVLRHYMKLINEPAILQKNIVYNILNYHLGPVVALFLLTLFIVNTIIINDHSPLLIILFTAYCYTWLYFSPINYKVKKISILIKMAFLSSFILALYLIYAAYSDGELIKKYAGSLLQSDRFLVWLSPWDYPDSGRQLQLALKAVNGNGHNWLGASSALGNGDIQAIPAIQDDFAPAFFLNKFGGIAGLILLAAQLFWLRMLVQYSSLGLRCAADESYSKQNTLVFLASCLFGFAAMQLAHWLISWSNTLGLLPIMGQPMTFLSSGNSHLFALALPEVVCLLLMIKLTSNADRLN